MGWRRVIDRIGLFGRAVDWVAVGIETVGLIARVRDPGCRAVGGVAFALHRSARHAIPSRPGSAEAVGAVDDLAAGAKQVQVLSRIAQRACKDQIGGDIGDGIIVTALEQVKTLRRNPAAERDDGGAVQSC